MSLDVIILMAIISVVGGLITTLRFVPWKTLMGMRAVADIGFTGILLYFFAGTLGGMLVAAVGGLLFSIFLSIGSAFTPAESITDEEEEV